MRTFEPHLEALPAAQVRFWPELRAVPKWFVLYGGTAITLRLGHRQSVDFDFFATRDFSPAEIARSIPWLAKCRRMQSEPNTLTVSIRRRGTVKVSFLGGLSIGRVGHPDLTADGTLLVASLLDLAATKVAVLQQRSEKKDYLDLAALLEHGVKLSDALAAASALYGKELNPMISLKALTYFGDGDLHELPTSVKERLLQAARDVTRIPRRARVSSAITPRRVPIP
jgi:hypothetical protein